MDLLSYILGLVMLVIAFVFGYLVIFTKFIRITYIVEVLLWIAVIVVVTDAGLSSDLMNPHNWMVFALIIATLGRIIAIIKSTLKKQ